MGNTNRFEGGMGFTGGGVETQATEYITIPKSSLSPEQQATYVAAIQTMGGLKGDKWKGRITRYFNKNDRVIDLQQGGLNQFDLKKIFNEYSDDEEYTVLEVEDESYREYLNNRLGEKSERYAPGLEGDRLNESNNEKLEVESNYPYPTRLAVESDYGDKSVLSDWLLIEKNSQEHHLLINNIRNKGLIPSLKLLNQMHPEIRNLKQKKKVSGEYLAFINATRELYGLPPYPNEPEESAEGDQPVIELDGQEPTLVEEDISADTVPGRPAEGEELQVEEGVVVSREPTTGESPEQVKDFEGGEGAEDELPGAEDELPGAEDLQAELDRLIEVETQKEQTKESLSYNIDQEKLTRFKDNARQAISNFQQFVSKHSSPADKANPRIQERYQLLEKQAWNSLYNLANLLDGEIATLPQDRDIQLSHPGEVDTRQYLEARGYKFDENGDITHITDKGVEIELNRAMKTESLIKSKRPSHIVYDKSISLDNDINYQGYLVRGLNQQTPDFIVGVLDKNNLESVIVDETGQSTAPTTEVVAPPEINPETPEQAEGGEDLPIDHPDRGSLYYQEIQLWNNIQALENRQKENPKDTSIKAELEQAKQAYQEFRSAVSSTQDQDKFQKFLKLRESYAKAESENTRGRFWKLLGLKKKNNSELEDIRSQYNEALEALLKTETSIDVEGKIKEMFSNEVQRLSGERVVQTKELQEKNQSGLDRALNPLKDRIFNWYVKNKSAVGAVNLGLFATSTFLAFTGAGIPLAGVVNTLRQAILYPMAVASGISSRELIRSKFEDENTNLNLNKKIFKFNLKTNFEFLKFKGGITKLVDKSLQNNYIQNASNEDLSKLVSTLESYYGLNGGNFTELNQQKAYEMGLNELGARLERANNQSTDEQDISSESSAVNSLDYQFDFKNTKDFKIKTVNGLVTRISQDRISALNAQKNKRLVANVAGTALGGSLLFNLVAQDLQLNKPNLGDSASTTGAPTPDTQGPGAGTGGAITPETGGDVPKPNLETNTPPTGTGTVAEEAVRQARAAAEQAQELARDVSSLDSGETIWGEITKQLGENASQAQIQQAVENYLQSKAGQESIFELAKQTEGGREFLARWSIDTAGEMAKLELKDLYEVSKYLGEGELKGLTELSLDNIDALKQAVAPEVTEATTIDPTSPNPPAPAAGTEDIVSKPPAPSSPPVTEAPVAPPSPLESPVNTSQFTKSLSEAIGANNLTDSQIGSVLEAYADTDQGRESLYNLIITSEANNPTISDLLTEYNVIDIYDFADLSDNQLYALAQEVGVENLDKLPGFELNDIILSKFEDAPDTVELVMGLSPLDAVQRYVANELGDLPYDSSLPKNIVDNILDTDEGKEWFLKSITENRDGAPAKGDIRFMHARLFFNRNGITQGSDIDWNKLDQLRNGFVRHKIFWQDFPFKVDDKTVNLSLSRLLKPGPIPGIQDAVRQVLTRQIK